MARLWQLLRIDSTWPGKELTVTRDSGGHPPPTPREKAGILNRMYPARAPATALRWQSSKIGSTWPGRQLKVTRDSGGHPPPTPSYNAVAITTFYRPQPL